MPDLKSCRFHKSDNTCSIDDRPCSTIEGFEDWECADYQEREEI